MTALAADKARTRLGEPLALQETKVGASKTIYQGSMVARLAATGFAEAATTSTTIKVIGVAIRGLVSNATAGSSMVGTEAGDFEFENLGADLLVQADLGNVCYAADDNTVAKTDGTGTRSIAGIFMGFHPTSLKPIVRVGLGLGSS